jgi:uncharacterized protein (DUF1684 family)
MIFLQNCQKSRYDSFNKEEYLSSVEVWHQNRITNLKKPDGWLNLIGLYWLKEGENSFGSDSSNEIVFPVEKAPKLMGKIFLSDGILRVEIEPDINVICNSEKIFSGELKSDANGEPTILSYGSLNWFVIKRGNNFLLRLRDTTNPKFKNFKGIERFPVDLKWRIKAIFKAYDTPQSIPIPTVLGTVNNQPSPGFLSFIFDGKEHQLLPIAAPGAEKFFVIFADLTNGFESYGAGRFLYVDRPGKDGITYLDFNVAYNPPCAFTPYATCPLPPKQNRLPFKIYAGEKKYDENFH